MKTILSLVTFLSFGIAHASNTNGFDRGNGGDAVVCTSPYLPTTIQLLDWYERERDSSIGSLWAPLYSYKTTLGFLDLYIDRIRNKYPKYGYILRSLADGITISVPKNQQFIQMFPASMIPNIDDEGPYTIEANCHLEQLAINLSNQKNGFLIAINQDLYYQLPNEQQALLLLHELIYCISKILYPDVHFTSSKDIRTIVGIVATQNFDNAQWKPFLDRHLDFDYIASQKKNAK